MAGRVSKVEPLARLGDLNVTYGFSVDDENGAPLLLLAFGTIKEARACRLQIEAVVGRAKSLIDAMAIPGGAYVRRWTNRKLNHLGHVPLHAPPLTTTR